jgi:hypothetical protein
MIGGSAATCKYNLKDPRDLDAAFRATFYNSPTFDADGVKFNGTTQHADTYFVVSTGLSSKNAHLSIYNLYDQPSYRAGFDIGAIGTGVNSYELAISYEAPAGNAWYRLGGTGTTKLPMGTTDERGFYIATRDISNAYMLRNGVLKDTKAGAAHATANDKKIFYGAESNSAGTLAIFRSDLKYGYVSIGEPFTVVQAQTYSTLVNTFMTELSKNTY